MKVFLYSLTLFILLVSCNNEGIENSANSLGNPLGQSELLSELNCFNDSLLQYRTRGFAENALNGTSITCADLVGAYSGANFGKWLGVKGAVVCGVITAGWCSYKTYKILEGTRASMIGNKADPQTLLQAYIPAISDSTLLNENLPKQIMVDYSDVNEESKRIGAEHNIIVKNLLDCNFTPKETIDKFFTEAELKLLLSEEFSNTIDSISEDIIYRVTNRHLYTDNTDVSSKIINLFTQIVQQYPENYTDMEFVISFYKDKIKNTNELSDEEKNSIFYALSVAASSYELWETR